jgi:hypothetical protein
MSMTMTIWVRTLVLATLLGITAAGLAAGASTSGPSREGGGVSSPSPTATEDVPNSHRATSAGPSRGGRGPRDEAWPDGLHPADATTAADDRRIDAPTDGADGEHAAGDGSSGGARRPADGAATDGGSRRRERPTHGEAVGSTSSPDEPLDGQDLLASFDTDDLPGDAPASVRDLAASGAGVTIGGGFTVPGGSTGGPAGHGGPSDLKGGPGCSVACITNAVAYAKGTTATLVVDTDTPAHIWVFVWDEAGNLHGGDNEGALATSFIHAFGGLEPGTTYQAAAFAFDADGHGDQRYGSFTTRHRVIRVTFAPVPVSDHPYAGPLRAHYWVDGAWHHDLLQERPASDPVFPSRQLVLEDVGASTSVMVQVVDRGGKKQGFDSCGTAEAPADPNWSGHEECAAWSNAPNFFVHLGGAPNSATAAAPHVLPPVNLYGAGPTVWFQTQVLVEVWYA